MRTEKKDVLYEGKSKIVYKTDRADSYIVHFKDDATAFNGVKKAQLKDKGFMNNRISDMVFRFLEKNGIKTHQIEKLNDREILVHKVEIIPVEVVVRNRATGSIVKRLGLEKGRPFDPPLIEYFLKDDKLGDPLVSEGHIFHFGWAKDAELLKMCEISLKVNQLMKKVFSEIGLDLIDFKLEFGRDGKGNVLLADEFTPDGCRLWDKKTGEPMDKDRFRQDLGGVEEAYAEVCRRLETQLGGAQ
jgi:phosphoribosylaminoimidazole-succinocarboxamide synthase